MTKAKAREKAYYDGVYLTPGDVFDIKPDGKCPKWATELDAEGKPVKPVKETPKPPAEKPPVTLSEMAKGKTKTGLSE